MSICYHRYLSYPSNYISCKLKFKFTPEPLQWFLSHFLVFLICLLSAVVLVDQTYYYVMAGSDVRGCSEKQQQQYLFRDAHNMLCLVLSPQSRSCSVPIWQKGIAPEDVVEKPVFIHVVLFLWTLSTLLLLLFMMNEEDDLCIVLPNGCHITNDLLRLHLPLGGGPPLHPLILFIIIFLHFICPPTITLNSAHTKLTVRIYL